LPGAAMEEVQSKEEKKNFSLFVMGVLGCCSICSIVCMIGTAVVFTMALCVKGGNTDCSLVLLKPLNETEAASDGALYHKHRLVEMSPEKWGVDFGHINLGTAAVGSVSASVSTVGGADANADDAADPSAHATPEGDDKPVYDWGTITPDQREHMPYRRTSVATCIVCYLALKVVKLLSMTSQLDRNMWSVPVHLPEAYVSRKKLKQFEETLGLCQYLPKLLLFLVEYVLLSWAPNLAVLPLASIASEKEYANTALMQYNASNFFYVSLAIGFGVCCIATIVVLDKCFVQARGGDDKAEAGEWPQWKASNKRTKFARVVAGCARFGLACVAAGTVYVAVKAARLSWYLFLGIDLSALFNISFRFGVLGWSAFLRLGLTVQAAAELPASVVIFVLAHRSESED